MHGWKANGKPIKVVRTGGGEYISTKFNKFCEDECLFHDRYDRKYFNINDSIWQREKLLGNKLF